MQTHAGSAIAASVSASPHEHCSVDSKDLALPSGSYNSSSPSSASFPELQNQGLNGDLVSAPIVC